MLTESAINGDVDYLRGLKENVIIGRLIPARFDRTEEGRERLGIDDQDWEEPVGILAGVPSEEGIPLELEEAMEEAPTDN